MSFVRVASVSEIPEGGKEIFGVDDRMIVVFHVGGQYYALDDVCTHDDGPLGEGALCGFEIACPRHGAKFDIRTGAVVCMPATRATRAHEVKVDGQDIYVQLQS